MNIITRRLRKMIAAEPKKIRDLIPEIKREDAVIEYDITFDVDAKLASGGSADFSLPEMKETAKAMQSQLGQAVSRMNTHSFQEKLTDTVIQVIISNISENIFNRIPTRAKKNDVINRSSAKISIADPSAIFNNELKVHIIGELTADNVTEEFVEALKDSYENTANHCCSQIGKRISDFYTFDKSEGNGLDVIESVEIDFKSFEVMPIKIKETKNDEIKEKSPEDIYEEKLEKIRNNIETYRSTKGWPSKSYVKNICMNEGVKPQDILDEYKGYIF